MSDERERLIELAASAYRERDADGRVVDAPAWHDLDAEGRAEAHRRARVTRRLEAALDPEGLSSTARAVLGRIRRA